MVPIFTHLITELRHVLLVYSEHGQMSAVLALGFQTGELEDAIGTATLGAAVFCPPVAITTQ